MGSMFLKRNNLICCILVSACLSLAATESTPTGFQLVSGDARPPVVDANGTVTIHSGKKAIVQWDQFSIGKNTKVHFAQSDATSAILNRVVGFSESHIEGSLLSNGKVYLVNPNGVLIGPNGHIETAGFIASTLDILNKDFLRGKELLFRGESKQKIVNLGTIIAKDGDIVLIADQIDHSGSLHAQHGHVLLGCGSEILLNPSGKERMLIRISSQTVDELLDEMENGVSPYAKAVKSSGRISGSITGADIQLLGKEVYLLDGADIDASGDLAGGEILVGGDFQGSNPNILNADITYVAKNATIRANANKEGDGGKVIIWANDATGFFGHIEARGGPEGGNGGLIEVSADHLTCEGFADTRAPKGLIGNLLLDPTDIEISAAADTCPVACWTGGNYNPDCTSPNVINATTLQGKLAVSNVIITTSSGCPDAGSITVNATFNQANDLTLNATTDIIWNTNFSGSASVTLNAGGNIQMNNTLQTTGNIAINTGGSFTGNNGTVYAPSGAINATIGTDCILTTGSIFEGDAGCTLTIGGNLTMDGGAAIATAGGVETLVIVGGTASLTNTSVIQSIGALSGNVTLVVDNNNSSSPNIGAQNPMLTVDSTSSITSPAGTFTRIFTATQSQNSIDPAATFGNGNAPTTFTPGTPYVDTATEIWGTYYPSSAGGDPYTFFYKDTASPPPPPPAPPAPAPTPVTPVTVATATNTNVVSSSAPISNTLTTQQSIVTSITTPVPTNGGQAVPLTQNANQNALNDAMSQAQCP